MKNTLLKVENLSISFEQYGRGLRKFISTPIKDLNIEINRGEILAIVGASGSGKSLLAHAIIDILPPNAIVDGKIFYQGEILTKSKIKKYKREGHLFEVFIWANSSIDFEDEFHFDENNKITLLNGNSVDIQFLKSNAFDAFGIILRNEEKRYINLLEMELS